METDFYSDETVKFSLVEDKTVLKKLNKAEKDGEVAAPAEAVAE